MFLQYIYYILSYLHNKINIFNLHITYPKPLLFFFILFTAYSPKFFKRQHCGTEELAHLEMVGTIVHQLTDGVDAQELEKAGLGAYYTDHGVGVYPQAAAGWPWNAATIAVKGDSIADLQEDLAAEQKARATYEKLIDLCKDDQDVIDPLRFLREREVVHFQRFGEALRGVQDKLAEKKFYMNNNNDMKCR